MAFLIVFSVLAVVVTITSIVRGFVLSVLWGWFIAPVFGLPALGIVSAIGLCVVIAFIVAPLVINRSSEKSERKSPQEAIIESMILPLMSLFIGWVVHCFM